MADAVQFSLIGLDDVLGKMKALGPALKKKGARFAMRKAANLVAAAAISNAMRIDDPSTPSAIPKNIAVRFSNRRFKSTGDVMFSVGVMGGAVLDEKQEADGLPGKGTQHWRLREFGTERTAADPFMSPALADNVGVATNEAADQLNRWLDRNIRKLTKQGLL